MIVLISLFYHRKFSKAWWYKRKMQRKSQNAFQGTSIMTGVSYKISSTVVSINDIESSA